MPRFFRFHVDLRAGTLYGPDGEVRLRPKAYALLCLLVERAPDILTKEELLDSLWGQEHLGESSLSQVISELRKVLGDDPKAPRYIETIHRRGYRFIAPLSASDPGHERGASPNGGSNAERHRDADPEPAPLAARRHRWLGWALAAAALLVLAWGLVGTSPPAADRASSQPGGVAVVAVLPAPAAGDVPKWLRSAVPELVGYRLQLHPRIYVHTRQRVRAALRDLGPAPGRAAGDLEPWFRYLDADGLLVTTLRSSGDGRWVATLELVRPTGESRALGAAEDFTPAELAGPVDRWEIAALDFLELTGRPPLGTVRPDLEILRLFFEAEEQAETDPAAALATLKRAQLRRPRGQRLLRTRADLLSSLGETERAQRLARQARRAGSGLALEVWFSNLSGRPREALALLAARPDHHDPTAELWLQTLKAMAARPDARDALDARSVLASLPAPVADSWLAPELALLKARLAHRLVEPDAIGPAARDARRLATERGHRATAEQAEALLAAVH